MSVFVLIYKIHSCNISFYYSIRQSTKYNIWLITRFRYYGPIRDYGIIRQINPLQNRSIGCNPTIISYKYRLGQINWRQRFIYFAKGMTISINNSYIPTNIAIFAYSYFIFTGNQKRKTQKSRQVKNKV